MDTFSDSNMDAAAAEELALTTSMTHIALKLLFCLGDTFM